VANKSYEQYCGVAAALDRVGDRWTLLILRELSFGRQRFTDLRAQLPGIASNLLTDRLRDLEADGLVEQHELPAPAARTVYALTADGRRIIPVLRALARFGLPFLGDPDVPVRPRHAVYGGVAALLDPAARDVNLRLRFDLDGEQHWLEVRDGEIVRADRQAEPDLVFTGSAAALVELYRGAARETLEPRLQVTGSAKAWRSFERCFPVSSLTDAWADAPKSSSRPSISVPGRVASRAVPRDPRRQSPPARRLAAGAIHSSSHDVPKSGFGS
jgi:DNA-binding HxlR family transcriptional regulator